MTTEVLPRVALMGSVAYDIIGTTDKVFDRYGPGLNCKVNSQQQFFGGCGGNIAYGLRQQATPNLLLSSAGSEDFRRYAQHLGNDLPGVLTIQGAHCAKANIITDPNGVQFTAFAPGPEVGLDAWTEHLQRQPLERMAVFVCAPFPTALMQRALAHVKQRSPNTVNVWVPGQYADALDASALNKTISFCDVVIGNTYEIEHLRETQQTSLIGKTIIATDGARPVRALLSDGNQRTLPTPRVTPIVDPTGCGDAFVAGLVPALLRAIDEHGVAQWQRSINDIIRAGTLQAGKCVSHRGAQTYGTQHSQTAG